MTKTFCKFDHTAVVVDHPDKADDWDGSFDIVLRTATHVWVCATHSHLGHPEVLQVGIGGPSSTAYDEDGNCVLAVPIAWCTYLTPDEAEGMELARNAMEETHGRVAMKRGKTTISSIFGQIEGVIADAMVKEGKVNRIEPDLIPPTARYDDQGRLAHCALVFTPDTEREFNRRVANLRA